MKQPLPITLTKLSAFRENDFGKIGPKDVQPTDPLVSAEVSFKPVVKNYADVLKEYGLVYRAVGHYYQVGETDLIQGWILHISVIAAQLEHLLRVLIPILTAEKVVFQVVKDSEIAQSILSGHSGLLELGKVVKLFPVNDSMAVSAAGQLIALTTSFRGPRILTDRHLGSVVYTRYGACKPFCDAGGDSQDSLPHSRNISKPVIDGETIPFQLPKGVNWPFQSFAPAAPEKSAIILQDRYRSMQLLKADVKGNVYKGIMMEKWYKPRWCVIKEGRHCMNIDPWGRDIGDRLRWQYELHKQLETSIPLPKAYDLFEENGDVYFVMEFVKGQDLDVLTQYILQKKTWSHLPEAKRLQLLEYARQVLDIVGKMHDKGIIHRDITPVNFLVNKRQEVQPIDLELAYSEYKREPCPAFRLGTFGFMSSEQEAHCTPTRKEDVYGIGGLLIFLCTGLPPGQFALEDISLLREQLLFFMHGETPLVDLISRCCRPRPSERPSLSQLKTFLEHRMAIGESAEAGVARKNANMKSADRSKNDIHPDILHSIIEESIAGLSNSAFTNERGIWLSQIVLGTPFQNSHAHVLKERPSLYDGTAGPLFVLARALQSGFSLSHCQKEYDTNISYTREYYAAKSAVFPAGFFHGKAGVAWAYLGNLKAGLMKNETDMFSLLRGSLETCLSGELQLAYGISGIGMALLAAVSEYHSLLLDRLLRQCGDKILESQQKDGSWLTNFANNSPRLQVTGFAHGVAGIICFLLGYYAKLKDKSAETAIQQGLRWLIRQSRKGIGQIYWPFHSKTDTVMSGFENGYIGIALTFLKAYETLGDLAYRQIVENLLQNIPHPLVTCNTTLCNGLTGIGELYLEAAVILKNPEWENRARWLAQTLLHRRKNQPRGGCYWMINKSPTTAVGLMTGNSGILHFLLRLYTCNKLTHPFLAF